MATKAALWALAAFATAASSATAQPASEVGRRYEIRQSYETQSQASDQSTGSSSGHDIIVEHVVAERDGGLELEFDHPAGTSKDDRRRDWQLPVRVFRSADGVFSLLNRAQVEARIAEWLTSAKIDRRACGSWYFTWNAFKIECDPLSVLKTVTSFDIRSTNIGAGQLYKADGVIAAVPLRDISLPGKPGFTADMTLGPDIWRRQMAESDVVLGQMTGTPITIEQAMQQRASDQVSGTVNVRLDLGGDPLQIVRRTTSTVMAITSAKGRVERQTDTRIVERKRLD